MSIWIGEGNRGQVIDLCMNFYNELVRKANKFMSEDKVVNKVRKIRGNIAILEQGWSVEPFVVAVGYDIGSGEWGRGVYFRTYGEAREYFEEMTCGSEGVGS